MKFWLSTCWVGEGFLSCGTCLCPLGNDGGTMQPCYKWTRKGISTQISPEEMLSVAVKYTHSLWVEDKSSLGRRTFEEERGGGIHVSQPGSDTRLSSHVPEHSTFDGAPFPLQPPLQWCLAAIQHGAALTQEPKPGSEWIHFPIKVKLLQRTCSPQEEKFIFLAVLLG